MGSWEDIGQGSIKEPIEMVNRINDIVHGIRVRVKFPKVIEPLLFSDHLIIYHFQGIFLAIDRLLRNDVIPHLETFEFDFYICREHV